MLRVWVMTDRVNYTNVVMVRDVGGLHGVPSDRVTSRPATVEVEQEWGAHASCTTSGSRRATA